MLHSLLVHEGHVTTAVGYQEPFVRAEQRAELGMFVPGLERFRLEIPGLHPRHPQLTHGRPQRLRHRRLLGQRTEVALVLR